MNLLVISLVTSCISLSFGSNITSPLCDKTKPQLVVNSVAVKDTHTLYYFTDNIVTVVNVKNQSVTNVSDISLFFTGNHHIVTPIDMAYVAADGHLEIDAVKLSVKWRINLGDNSVISEGILSDKIINFGPLAILEANNTDAHIVSSQPSIRIRWQHLGNSFIDGNNGSSAEHLLLTTDDQQKVILMPSADGSIAQHKKLSDLNGHPITSAYKVGPKVVRFVANRYATDVELNQWTTFKVTKYTARMCGEMSAASVNVSGGAGGNANPMPDPDSAFFPFNTTNEAPNDGSDRSQSSTAIPPPMKLKKSFMEKNMEEVMVAVIVVILLIVLFISLCICCKLSNKTHK